MLDLLLVVIIAALFGYALKRAGIGSSGAKENRALATEFLQENGARESILTTTSGLQYEVLRAGKGERHPTAQDKVRVHYHGTLLNGKVFDSSVERGQDITFRLNQVISGWTEGVQLMVEGEKTRFYIPPDLAYGDSRAGDIPAGSLLIFEVELIEIGSFKD